MDSKINIFRNLEEIDLRIIEMEKTIKSLEASLIKKFELIQNHLIRVKNGDYISEQMITQSLPYNDLTPEKAFKIFNNHLSSFYLIDVSESDFIPPYPISNSIKISLNELQCKIGDYANKVTPLLLISENGTRSILACELLVEIGYYNCNNISGGHEFWPGHFQYSMKGKFELKAC